MRKWLTVLVIAIALIIAGIYILIPRTLVVSVTIPVNCTQSATYRILTDNTKWKKWWPGNESEAADTNGSIFFTFKNYRFHISQKFQNAIEIPIEGDGFKVNSTMGVFSLPLDSAAINWQCNLEAGANPVKRLSNYKRASDIKNLMLAVLQPLGPFVDKKENVYDYPFKIGSTKDTVLIATRFIIAVYPNTADIYRSVNLLKTFAAKQKAAITGNPMLNVTKLSDSGFQVMVALPVDRELPEKENIFKRRMVPGRFLITEVTGDVDTVKHALEQVQHYFADYKKTSMAIPFQVLVTDRSKELDSTKWVTQIYAPIY